MKAVIIGATSGIGRELVLRLACMGYTVGAMGRRRECLESLAAECPGKIITEAADVTDTAATQEALRRITERLGGMDLCVVSSGTGHLNPGLDIAKEQDTISTNITGWTVVVNYAYKHFEQQRGGHLVLITSAGGLRGSGIAPAYNATKAYQINYAEGLRQKACKQGFGITVTDIRPGLTDTAMAKGEGLFWVMPVEKVARQIIRAIKRRDDVCTVTRRWRVVAWIMRHLPDSLYKRMG